MLLYILYLLPLYSAVTYALTLYAGQLSGGKRGDNQNCSVLYCVLKQCTVISTLS